MPRAERISDIEEVIHIDGETFRRPLPKIATKKVADGLIKVLTKNMLAYRNNVVDAVALAGILRHDLHPSRVVADCHPATADSTDNQPLQQCRALAWWTLSAILAVGVGILP